MELVAFLESVSIVCASVAWLNVRLSKHINTVMSRYLKKVENEHKVITDRIDTLEAIIVEFRTLYKSDHCRSE